MYKQSSPEKCHQTISSTFLRDLVYSTDALLEFTYRYIELPIQSVFNISGLLSLKSHRSRSFARSSQNTVQILFHSYAITFITYFACLLLAQIFINAIQRYYFIDPFLSINRQCINIQFVRINQSENVEINRRLKDNFIQENFIVKNENNQQENNDYSRLHYLLNQLQNNNYVICQRSLYLYARFHSYASLLHSNDTQYKFFLPKYPSSFTIDRPPFLDLCIHASNHSEVENIKRNLLRFSPLHYPSINLFLFDLNFTQVSITLYELNEKSTHLERTSIHTGWLYDLYSQFNFLKYGWALSTALFNGLSFESSFIDYFDYFDIPLPSDPLLGLTEMVQQSILNLRLCPSTCIA